MWDGIAAPKDKHSGDPQDGWRWWQSHPRAEQLWEAVDCPTAHGEQSAVDSCWPLQSAIICHFRGVMLSTNQDSSRYGRVSLQKHQWKQTMGLKLTVLWELDLCTVLVGHLHHAQRGSPCHLFLEHRLWEACTSQWVGQQEKYLGPERLHSVWVENQLGRWLIPEIQSTYCSQGWIHILEKNLL